MVLLGKVTDSPQPYRAFGKRLPTILLLCHLVLSVCRGSAICCRWATEGANTLFIPQSRRWNDFIPLEGLREKEQIQYMQDPCTAPNNQLAPPRLEWSATSNWLSANNRVGESHGTTYNVVSVSIPIPGDKQRMPRKEACFCCETPRMRSMIAKRTLILVQCPSPTCRPSVWSLSSRSWGPGAHHPCLTERTASPLGRRLPLLVHEPRKTADRSRAIGTLGICSES